jgi:hypothetical protein
MHISQYCIQFYVSHPLPLISAFNMYSGNTLLKCRSRRQLPDWGLSFIYSVPPGKSRNGTFNENTTVSGTSLLTLHCSLSFDVTQSELLTAPSRFRAHSRFIQHWSWLRNIVTSGPCFAVPICRTQTAGNVPLLLYSYIVIIGYALVILGHAVA